LATVLKIFLWINWPNFVGCDTPCNVLYAIHHMANL